MDKASFIPRGKHPEIIVPMIVAMKGRGCTGKTTLARELASSFLLRGYECSLFSYDDVRASIRETLGLSSADEDVRSRESHDDLAYQALWQIASSDLSVASSGRQPKPRIIVIDCSLSLRSHLDKLLEIFKISPRYFSDPFLAVVECRPSDELTWRWWLEGRAATAVAAADKPSSWEDIEKEVSDYVDYSMDDIPCLIVDTSDSRKSARDHAANVISWLLSYYRGDKNSDSTTAEAERCQQSGWRHFSHPHTLFPYPNYIAEMKNNESTVICALCQGSPSSSVYGCSPCGFYLDESCAELPPVINFGGRDFDLGQTGNSDLRKSGNCLLCNSSSGVLYTERFYGLQIHPKCAQIPRRIKHTCHEHCLELKSLIFREAFICFACGNAGRFTCYYCTECNIYFHLVCTLYLEARVSHERHWHPLVLCTIPTDGTNEYYCEICAEERHPDLWAYYCANCEYEAHVSCVNPNIKPCHPDVFLSANRGEGMLKHRQPRLSMDEYKPFLREIAGPQLAWESVDSQEESKVESKPE
ncbi:hypothetical protein MLD38_038058 [Melastoma candidum]|nr:hypothetical protein MLD38_038058 [Melastoma candidum]